MNGIRSAILAIPVLLLLNPSVWAGYISRSYLLDHSNVLPNMLNYGLVTVEAYDGNGAAQGELAAGQVRLSFQANLLPIYGPPNGTFGLQSIGFNTSLPLHENQISVPSGWQLHQDSSLGDFGHFAWQAQAADGQGLPQLVITIDGLGEAARVEHFLVPSLTEDGDMPPQGSVYFAGRIGGFAMNNDFGQAESHQVGSGFPLPPPMIDPQWPIPESPVDEAQQPPPNTIHNPEPSTLLLCALGAGSLGLGRWLRRRRP